MEQSFNGGYFVNSLWTTNGYRFYQFIPLLITDAGSTTEGTQKNMDLVNHVCRPYYSQMKSYVFDDIDNEIVNQKLNYDVLNIHMVMTSTANQNLGAGPGNGDRWVVGMWPGSINNKELHVAYTTNAGLGADDRGTRSEGWITGNSASEYIANVDAATAKNLWAPSIPFPDSFATKFSLRRQDWVWWTEAVPACSYFFTRSTDSEDKNIYIYNECHDVIYAHALSATKMEEYIDYMDAINSKPNKDDLIIGSDRTNLYLGQKTEPWVYWGPWRENTSTNTWHWVRSEQNMSPKMGSRRQWRFLPKFKLKNESTIVPPNTKSVSGGTNYWNTLNQFKNGLLKFSDYNGNTIYPHYYGGLPLISIGNENMDELTFNINLQATTTAGTVPTNACIQIKIDEFPNNKTTSTWSSEDKDKLIEFSAEAGASTYNYDKTNQYLKIPLNTNVKIKIEEPKNKTTLYLRWWEDGNANHSGGKIMELNNAIAIAQ